MGNMQTHAEHQAALRDQPGWMGQSGAKEAGEKSEAESQREGPVAKTIEEQTAKLPSDFFLWAAGAAILVSLGYQIFGSRRGFLGRSRPARAPTSTFVGMWVPTILLLGIYNKIVKVAGSDRTSRQSSSEQSGSQAGAR